MILTIISTLLGILSSALPNLLRYFERRQELRYATEIMQIRADVAVKGFIVQEQEDLGKALIEEGESIRKHDALTSAGGIWDALRASVRPVITYTFFILFIFVKSAVAWVLLSQYELNLETMKQLSAIIFDDSTVAIFSTILGFWFGSRAMSYAEDRVFGRTSDRFYLERKGRRR